MESVSKHISNYKPTCAGVAKWRYAMVLFLGFAGIVLSIVLFFLGRELEQKHIQGALNKQLVPLVTTLQVEIGRNIEIVESVGSFYDGSVEVTRQEFSAFVARPLLFHDDIQALEWIPRVGDEEREVYEEKARREGFAGFQFTERNVQCQMVRAKRRAEYFPIYYVEPLKGNEAAVGFDLASEPRRQRALERARDTNSAVTTERITLVQETGEQYGFLILRPIYRKDAPLETVEQRRKYLVGYALGVFRIGDMVERAWKYFPNIELDVYIYEETALKGKEFLYSRRREIHDAAGHQTPNKIIEVSYDAQRRITIDLPGRQWTLVFSVTPAFTAKHAVNRALPLLLMSLLLTTLLVGYLYNNLRRSAKIEELAYELAQANKSLEQRVEERTKELKDAQDELVRKEKLAMLGQLASSVSHELRNPIGVIGNSVYYLKMKLKDEDEKVVKHLNILQKEVQRSTAIITNLLDFSKVMPPSLKKADVNSIVKETLADIEIPENITIETLLDNDLSEIPLDPEQIHQAFMNLISNAVQAMSEGGRLTIKTWSKGDFVDIMFSDTGKGISEENLPKIFEPLFTTKAKGIGLGLAIVKGIVDGHKGRIEVDSAIGRGTNFTVKLPMKQIDTDNH